MTVLAGLGPERVSESAVAEMLVRHINWHHWQAADSGRNGNFSCLIAFLPRHARSGFSCNIDLVVRLRTQPDQLPPSKLMPYAHHLNAQARTFGSVRQHDCSVVSNSRAIAILFAAGHHSQEWHKYNARHLLRAAYSPKQPIPHGHV